MSRPQVWVRTKRPGVTGRGETGYTKAIDTRGDYSRPGYDQRGPGDARREF